MILAITKELLIDAFCTFSLTHVFWYAALINVCRGQLVPAVHLLGIWGGISSTLALFKYPIPSIDFRTTEITFYYRHWKHRDGKPAVYAPDGNQYWLFGLPHRYGGPDWHFQNEPRYHLFGMFFYEDDYNRITAGKSETEVACALYLSDTQEFAKDVIEKFLEMRGKRSLIKSLKATAELAS